MTPNGNCPTGAAHAQQIRLLEERAERLDEAISHKADASCIERLEEKMDRLTNMFWALITLVLANLIGIILMLLRTKV
ncbi:MAG: hypothetical protein Kow0099_04300 [Candidatus Abyssubacteria bacterium]